MILQKYENVKMKELSLKVADYNIHLKSCDMFFLKTEEAYQFFLNEDKQQGNDLHVNIHHGLPVLPPGSKKVFSSGNHDLIEMQFDHNWYARLRWDILGYDNKLFVRKFSEEDEESIDKILELDFRSSEWDIYFNEKLNSNTGDIELDPLAYPLGPLLIYYLVTLKGGIMLHSSGISYSDRGFVFTGFSGRGKSTMARLWKEAGAKVINDDRLILKHKDGKVYMYNSPMYYPDKPVGSIVHDIFAIHHAKINTIKPYDYINGMAKIMAFSIQHNYSDLLINKFIDNVTGIAGAVSVNELGFLPDKKVIELLKGKYGEVS